MAAVLDAVDILKQVEETAETHKVAEERDARMMPVGRVFRQGDLYIHRVTENFPHGPFTPNRQLVDGTSKGSRHVAELPAKCYLGVKHPTSQMLNRSQAIGPLIHSEEEFVISHPEHSDVRLSGGWYQITHQMDPNTLIRVMD